MDGENWGETRLASDLGLKPGKRDYAYVWCKCPRCGRGKWSHKSWVASDGVTSRTRCEDCCGTPKRYKPGDRVRSRSGYAYVYVGEDDPFWCMASHRRVPEHRLVMARTLGRPLSPEENVRHKNGKRDDNRPENLELRLRLDQWDGGLSEAIDRLTLREVLEAILKSKHADSRPGSPP